MPSSLDHEWFLSILDEHQRLIHKICWTYADSQHTREDLFQEIVLRLLSALRTYDPSRKLSTWLYRVALNVAIDFHRKRRHHPPQTRHLDDNLQPAATPDLNRVDELRDLHELLHRQSEVDRALLLLYLEGNSHREIAEVLGFSESNVGTRLGRLIKSLRHSLNHSDT